MPAVRITKELPPWLRPGYQHNSKRKSYHRTQVYFTQMHMATPDWYANNPDHIREFRKIVRKAQQLRATGRDVHVDHIVPLRSKYVCGLNVHWNLQILEAGPNMRKGNNWWPGCPWGNDDLFGAAPPDPHQLRLLL